MKIKYEKTFLKSFKSLLRRNIFIDIWEFFRYDLPYFFKNICYFRKEMWKHRKWDYHYSLILFRKSLTMLRDVKINDHEIEDTKNKKILQMNRVIQILDNIIDDNYIEMAEKESNKEIVYRGFEFIPIENSEYFEMKDDLTESESESNRTIYTLSNTIGENEWNELWDILKGKDYESFIRTKEYDELSDEDKEKTFNDIYDGSDLRGWWC